MGPKGVSVDHEGHVIVVDNKACTVFIFQLSGKLVTKFGSRGNGDKQFAGKVRWPDHVTDFGDVTFLLACVPEVRTSPLSTRTTRSS